MRPCRRDVKRFFEIAKRLDTFSCLHEYVDHYRLEFNSDKIKGKLVNYQIETNNLSGQFKIVLFVKNSSEITKIVVNHLNRFAKHHLGFEGWDGSGSYVSLKIITGNCFKNKAI